MKEQRELSKDLKKRKSKGGEQIGTKLLDVKGEIPHVEVAQELKASAQTQQLRMTEKNEEEVLDDTIKN